MPLGIRPTVDFAFKKIFGSPQNSIALIGLLNAILDLEVPIVAVEIINPFSYQEFVDSKLIVLDVRCQDDVGRVLNVEMQVSMIRGLLGRLVFYASSMYVEQLSSGDNYAILRPAISICLLTRNIFDSKQPHHRFRMVDLPSGRHLEPAIEVHTVELAKYNSIEGSTTQTSKIQQWAFLLQQAQNYDSKMLKEMLPGPEFQQAIETIEVIAAKTEDRTLYNQREKAQRDYDWAISGAREEAREQGLEEGLAQGRELGLEQGLAKGLVQGRELGRQEGKLLGKIQILQELLGEPAATDSDYKHYDINELNRQLLELQNRLRQRDS